MQATGSTIWLAVPHPVVGKMGKVTVKTYCNTAAMTKVGMVVPRRAMTIMTLSDHLLRFKAATMPRMMPMVNPIIRAMPPTAPETGA